MDPNGKRGPVIRRRVNVSVLETARMEKGLSSAQLCAKAKVDQSAYRNLLRYEGERSRDSVIVGVAHALGLSIKEIVTITPVRREATCESSAEGSGGSAGSSTATR